MNRSLVLLALLSIQVAPCLADNPYRLTGPRVAKVDSSSRGLSAGDLDGDGRQDLAVINNDHAQIDLLYQRTPAELKEAARTKLPSPRWEPIIEDAPFLKESVTTGDYMYDCAILDVNGDGRADLVYTGKRDRLAVKLQTGAGQFDDEWTYDRDMPSANVGSLAIADVDRDGRDDLIALTTQAVLLFRLKGAADTFPRPDEYRVSEENPQRLEVKDLNGDQLPDLAYMAESSERALRVRYQDQTGGFGPELGVPVPVGSADWEVLPCEDGSIELITIKRTRSELQFTPLTKEAGVRAHRKSLAIRSYPVPKSGVDPSLYAVGDFDGDGRLDVAVADTDGAAVYLYVQDDSGEFRRPREYPSLQGISSIAVLRLAGAERDALLVCSEKEGMVGISRMEASGRLSFPENLAVPGTPLVAVGADLDADGASEVIVATKDGRRFNLELLRFSGGEWVGGKPVKLGAIKRSPTALLAQDLNDDGAPDLVMFIPREATRLFVKEEDSFREIGEEDSLRTSQFEGVLPKSFGVGDFTGDGKSEMLVAGKGFVRAYRIKGDGALEIVDQANARSSLDELSGPILFDLDGDGTSELLSYFADEARMQVMARDAAGLYSYRDSLDLAPIGLVRVTQADLKGNAGRRLLFFGKDRFWSVPPRELGGDASARPRSYRTDLEEVEYSRFTVGDLNGDGSQEIIAVDTTRHVLEVLKGGCGAAWTNALFFTIFEQNRFNRGNTGGGAIQPREMLVGDFTGDGRSDLVLLCHDRVLLYPQEKPGEKE
ncbi:MAG: VCBS repeat-containing protein [Planctomycetota bacterium]